MKPNRSGFSLVLSLTIMAAMVMMVIVLASFLQVESRLAQSNAGFLRARFNALASARIAVAQLQVMAGPDQRVTMRADMFAPDATVPPPTTVPTGSLANPNKPPAVSHQRRYWTGVWATGGIDSSKPRDWNVSDPHDTRLFLGWLTSPIAVDGSNPELADANQLNYYLANRNHFDAVSGKVAGGINSEGQQLINQLSAFQNPVTTPNFVRLVGGSPVGSSGQVAGSVQWPAAATTPFHQEYYGAVDLPSMPMPGPTMTSGALGARGRYAYWIGDEGIKAKVNLPDANAPFPPAAVTEWDRGFAGSAAQRSAIESVTPSLNATVAALLPGAFSTNYLSWRANDALTAGSWGLLQLPKTQTRGDLSAWAARLGGGVAAGDTMAAATRLLWHEITPLSYSVLTDTLNGGLKTDLSTAFELPYSVFRTLEMYPGQKDATTTPTIADRRQSFFHGAPNATFNAGMASDLDYNRPNLVDKIGSPQELLLASPRAAEWAPRYLGTLSPIGSTVDLIRNRNGSETPERLGFAYEVPLASAFFNPDRLAANLVSLTAASGERSQAKNDALPWSDIGFPSGDPLNHPDNWTSRIVRGPTWDLYRNFYRMYKRETEAAAALNSSALRGQGAPSDDSTCIVRGIEPLTYATGNRGLPTRRNGPAQNDSYTSPVNPVLDNFFSGGGEARNYYHRNNLADGGVSPLFQAERRYRIPFDAGIVSGTLTPEGLSIQARHRVAAGISQPSNLADGDYADGGGRPRQVTTTRTWPTSPSLAPTVLRFSTIYSAVRQSNKLGMTVDPIIVIHNPYDVPLEFEGLAMVTSGISSPFRFIFRANGLSITSTEWQFAQRPGDPLPPGAPGTPGVVSGTNWSVNNPVTNQTIDFGDVVIGGGENDNRSMSFRIVAGSGGTTNSGGRVIRLEPGEIKVIGTSPSTGDLINSGNTNVSIPGDVGFELSSRAFYRMTPFHNIRSRLGSGARNQTAERVLWSMDFFTCTDFAAYDPDGGGPLPAITWTNVGLADPTYAQRLNDLWTNARNQRRLKDAFPGWNGTLSSLEASLGTRSIEVITRNQGWVNYNGFLVGAEGETITLNPGPDNRFGTGDDVMDYIRSPSAYIAPTLRNGRVSVHGNQSWNFYLIGKKSIDGGTPLNTHRRWFGTPDEDTSTYIQDPANPNRLIRRYNEGSLTANGFNQVDESLLLNFQAMTSGWPMYSNGNNDEGYYKQPDREWTRALGASPDTPSFYIKGSDASSPPPTVPVDPEFNVGNGKGLEVTNSKADTLFNSQTVQLPPNTDKRDVFMVDFVLRAADMTRNTDKWYPRSMTSAGFGMRTTTPSNIANDYGANYVLQTPEEMRNAPMTPYFLSYRAQQAQLFGYDGKAHTPVGWVETQRILASGVDTNFPTANGGRNAFWGPSMDNDSVGKTHVILFPVPRRPLLSLSQLGAVPFAEVSTDADLTVGSSFAHPGIGDLTRIVEWPGPRQLFPSEAALASEVKGPVPELGYVAKHMGTRPVRNRSEVRTDHAFAANYALWDTYYFSGLNLQANSYSHLDGSPRDWPNSGADLPIDVNVRTQQAASLASNGVANTTTFASLKTALNEGGRPLANKRMTYIADGKPSFTLNPQYQTTLRLPETEFPHPKYLARTSLYDGGFNVNSTSRAAWRAVLGGLKGQTLPDATNPANPAMTALTKFARAFGPADSTGNDPWTQYRELSEAQIDELAGRVVQEVRIRGPFMSLGDFINRRLVNNDTFGLKGALQAAIDNSSINNSAIAAGGGTFPAPPSTTPTDANAHLWSSMYHSSYYPARNPPQTNWWREQSAYPNIPANKRFPSIRAMSRTHVETSVTAALGAPGIVTQMDVLNSAGPNLTVRSDTFVVRAYGEAQDDAGNVIGKAWVELVVQRSTEYMAMAVGQRYPEYVEPTRRRLAYRVNTSANKEYDRQVLVETYEAAPPPNPPGSSPTDRTILAQEQRLNRILGRRFRAIGLRWLSANEI